MNAERRATIKQLLEQAQSYFNELSVLYTAHNMARLDNGSLSALSQTSLLKCMNGILKIYKSCRKLDRVLKTYYFSVPEVLSLVSAIKYDIKKEKSNKIKQHIDQVFESSNRGLLEGEKRGAGATAPTGMGDTQVSEKPPEGAGTWVDWGDEDGTPVDGVVGERCGAPQAGALPSSSVDAKDYASGVDTLEKDISTMLAAANVDEKVQDTGALLNGDSGVDKEDKKSSEACADPDSCTPKKVEDLLKAKDCLETVHNISQLCMTLCKSLQDTIDTIYAAMDMTEDTKETNPDKAQESSEKMDRDGKIANHLPDEETEKCSQPSETADTDRPANGTEENGVETGGGPDSAAVAKEHGEGEDHSSPKEAASPDLPASLENGKEEEEDVEGEASLTEISLKGTHSTAHFFSRFHGWCFFGNTSSSLSHFLFDTNDSFCGYSSLEHCCVSLHAQSHPLRFTAKPTFNQGAWTHSSPLGHSVQSS